MRIEEIGKIPQLSDEELIAEFGLESWANDRCCSAKEAQDSSQLLDAMRKELLRRMVQNRPTSDETCNCSWGVAPHIKQPLCPQTVPEEEQCMECKHPASSHKHDAEALLNCSECRCERFIAVINTYFPRHVKKTAA